MTFLFIAGYLICAVICMRVLVRYYAREYPCLPWTTGDSAMCIFCGLIWPITALILGSEYIVKRLKTKNIPPILPFKKWHERDIAKIHERISNEF